MKNRYGQLPKPLGEYIIIPTEMMFYQDMPIKLKRFSEIVFEDRLKIFDELITTITDNFIITFGFEKYINSYVYISAKYLFQNKQEPFNRPGWPCDGFMSDDITDIWSDENPTVFNLSQFALSQDDTKSIQEMGEQAEEKYNFTYPKNTLLRLDQFNVHKVAEIEHPGMRLFLKVSFSSGKFDLKGNTHNYLLDYSWELKDRSCDRNIPQSLKKNN